MSLKFGILGLLASEPLHGYEIKTRFEHLLGGTWEVNIGQIYTTLQRLERDKLVETTGSRGDRGKQHYRVTACGRSALDAWLAAPDDAPQRLREDVYLKLLLTARLAGDDLERLLVRQQRVYLQRLRDLADLEKQAGAAGRDDLLLLVKGAILHTEADLEWVDVCFAELRRDQGDRR